MNDGSEPLTYNEGTREFTADTDDDTLIGTMPDYGVTATFDNYPPGAEFPIVSTSKNGADVEFDEPCLDPFSYSSTAQTDPAPDSFSGDDIIFNLNRFLIEPTKCKITYNCESVSPVGVGAPTCGDFTFDGVFDGVGPDGQLVFVATP